MLYNILNVKEKTHGLKKIYVEKSMSLHSWLLFIGNQNTSCSST